jgi:hypothetical protein
MTSILRPLVTAYASLSILLPAAGLPRAIRLAACLVALLAIGELWVRALTGRPAETGLPAVRPGLVVLAGLLTLPAVALLLHPLGIPVEPVPLIGGAIVLTALLGTAALVRHYAGQRGEPAEPEDDQLGVPAQRLAGQTPHRTGRAAARTAAAILLPIGLALAGGGIAIRAVEQGSHPTLPGYLTVALNGWAAGISRPVVVPAQGIAIPVRVSSSGLPTTTQWLRLRVGSVLVAAREVTVVTGKVYALSVQLPALPADGCPRPVGISVGGTGTVFYARSAVATDRFATSRGRPAC